MARVSAKALRPRQYVFNRLPEEKIKALSGAVKKLKEKEKHDAVAARAATRAVKEHQAARHAEKIILGIREMEPESEAIRQLEKELEELRQRKKYLFEKLKRYLDKENQVGKNLTTIQPTTTMEKPDEEMADVEQKDSGKGENRWSGKSLMNKNIDENKEEEKDQVEGDQQKDNHGDNDGDNWNGNESGKKGQQGRRSKSGAGPAAVGSNL